MTAKDKQIKDGQDAQIILDDPLVIGAFNKILNEGYQQWISTKAIDKDEREALYHQQIAALKFKQVLINTIENGKLLEEERKQEGKANG
jgi:hypothetical protein|tara:strand:+ start:158 stop:424 length:267 start_codon:yes stop_codon:yes gene_type:complete